MTATLAELHTRSFPADIELRDDPDDGMTVIGVVVPYGVEVPVLHEPVGPYRELFARGAFDRAVRRPTVVSLTFRHDITLAARLGYARSFRDSAEGLVGEFRLDPSSAAKARDVLSSSHRAFSVGFVSVVPRAGTERPGGLVVRRSAILDHVAATDSPVYEAAGVTTIRHRPEDDEPTDADVAAQAQQRADDDLWASLDAAAAEQERLRNLLAH